MNCHWCAVEFVANDLVLCSRFFQLESGKIRYMWTLGRFSDHRLYSVCRFMYVACVFADIRRWIVVEGSSSTGKCALIGRGGQPVNFVEWRLCRFTVGVGMKTLSESKSFLQLKEKYDRRKRMEQEERPAFVSVFSRPRWIFVLLSRPRFLLNVVKFHRLLIKSTYSK